MVSPGCIISGGSIESSVLSPERAGGRGRQGRPLGAPDRRAGSASKAVVRNAILDKNVVVRTGCEIGVEQGRRPGPRLHRLRQRHHRRRQGHHRQPRADSGTRRFTQFPVAAPGSCLGYSARIPTIRGNPTPVAGALGRAFGCGSALDGEQEAVADGQQVGDEVLVLLDRVQRAARTAASRRRRWRRRRCGRATARGS